MDLLSSLQYFRLFKARNGSYSKKKYFYVPNRETNLKWDLFLHTQMKKKTIYLHVIDFVPFLYLLLI